MGYHRAVSIKSDIDILPNIRKTADTPLDFCMMPEADEIDAGWIHKGEVSNKEYVSLSIAAPEFGPKIFCANFGVAIGYDDKDLYAVIWNRFDQTKAPVQDLHEGNYLQC